MLKQNSLKKDYFFSLLIGSQEGFPWGAFAFLCLISFLPYLGAAFDASLFLPGQALGIFEHYGNVCFTVVFPLIFLFGVRGIRCFDRFISGVDANLIKDKFERKLRIEEFLRANLAKDPYVPLKFLVIFSGLVFATANAINALNPVAVWSHDVYDSVSHIGGYIAQRVFFYVWWAYLLPIFVYRLFVVVIMT